MPSSITIYGGTIEATGGTNSAGIGGGVASVRPTITIYGGSITATGGYNGAGIGGGFDKNPDSTQNPGTITIYGGTITATGGKHEHVSGFSDMPQRYAAGIGGGHRTQHYTINIYGGNITASRYAYHNGYGIRGQITLSYRNAGDSIYATNYGGTVTVADGKTFIVDGTEISGTLEIVTEESVFDTCPAIDDKTLTPPSYNVNVGTTGITASTAVAFPGETVTVSPAEGYNLTSVNVNGTAITGNTFTMPANDVTVTATTSLITYTITYELDGGTVSTANPASYTVETATLTLNNPTKTGYTFAGWTAFEGGVKIQELTIKKGSTGNKTYTANWTLNQYTLTFDTQGGSEISAITQDYDTAITAPNNPTRAGYTFAGWDKEIPAKMPAEDMTFTAQWTAKHSYWGETDIYTPDGTNDKPYVISTLDGWNLLAEELNSGNGYGGKIFRLDDNLTVTSMLGIGTTGFAGTFEGNGKKLTLNLTADGEYVAPFRNVNGGTIKGLRIDGTITASGKYAGGLIGQSNGATKIEDC